MFKKKTPLEQLIDILQKDYNTEPDREKQFGYGIALYNAKKMLEIEKNYILEDYISKEDLKEFFDFMYDNRVQLITDGCLEYKLSNPSIEGLSNIFDFWRVSKILGTERAVIELSGNPGEVN